VTAMGQYCMCVIYKTYLTTKPDKTRQLHSSDCQQAATNQPAANKLGLCCINRGLHQQHRHFDKQYVVPKLFTCM
jgi:hypothetical protein